MACNCYNANDLQERKYTQLLEERQREINPTAIPRWYFENLREFRMCGFIPSTNLTTSRLVCANPRLSRAICKFRPCMPH